MYASSEGFCKFEPVLHQFRVFQNNVYIYSNMKDASDFHGTVSFDPMKMSQQFFSKVRHTKVGN